MANVLTDLSADLYVAADRVGRELTGFIASSTVNSGAERAAVGQTVRAEFSGAATVVNRTESMALAEGTDQTSSNRTMTLSSDKAVNIPWTGNDVAFLDSGSGFQTNMGGKVLQAMRAITNLIEADLANAAYLACSRAYGAAGTTPFGTAGDFSDGAHVLKILKDNGYASGDESLVIDTTAGASFIGKQSRADIAGDTSMLRQGVIFDVGNMAIRESAAIVAHTKGTGTSYQLNGALAVGDTTVTVDTGSGTIVAGDVVTISNHKYVVATALSGGVFTVNAPGIREIVADNTAVTVANTSSRNVAFSRSALELAIRAPSLPFIGGQYRDAAVDRQTIVDPRTGLAFDASVYAGQGKMTLQIAATWGVKAWEPKAFAALLG
jgi:hypothetical protein